MSPACLSARKKRREKLWKWNTKIRVPCMLELALQPVPHVGVECKKVNLWVSPRPCNKRARGTGYEWSLPHIKHVVEMGRKVSFAFHKWNIKTEWWRRRLEHDVIEEKESTENPSKCETNSPLPISLRPCMHIQMSENGEQWLGQNNYFTWALVKAPFFHFIPR